MSDDETRKNASGATPSDTTPSDAAQDTSSGREDEPPRKVPFQRLVEARREGKPLVVEALPPLPASSEPRVPFGNFVAAKKAGLPVDIYPLPPGAVHKKIKSATTWQIRGGILLLGIVIGTMSYLGAFGKKDDGPSEVGFGRPVVAAPALAEPAPRAAPGVRATFYLDASIPSHLVDIHRNVLRNGDSLTVLPATVGVDYLYLILLGLKNELKLNRIYPPQLLASTPPPRKYVVKGEQAGQFQVVLLGTREEIGEKLQLHIQQANLAGESAAPNIRQQRLERLLLELKSSLPDGDWTYYALDAVAFEP